MSAEITVVDYGVGNLFSVCRALEHCGAKVILATNPDAVRRAPKVVLPGVGAYSDGMASLAEHGMDQAVKEAVDRGSFLFGVCLGMQFLLDESEEFGLTKGLGLIPGKVISIPGKHEGGNKLKIPHIGWNSLVLPSTRRDWNGTLLQSVPIGTSMYFVHSFMAAPSNPVHRLADCVYGDTQVAAIIGRDNVWGAQFHPEKSGEAGLSILRQFVEQE